MPRFMADSVTVADLPPHADLYAGYIDGRYANVDAIRKRFPHKPVVTITVNGLHSAQVIDCETGDATPDGAGAWAARQAAAGNHPTIYCNLSTWPAVIEAVARHGVKGKVSYWIAHYNGDPTIPAGAVAVQYQDHGPHGEHYDMSAVVDYWPGVDKPSKPKGLGRLLHAAARYFISRDPAKPHGRRTPLAPHARVVVQQVRDAAQRMLELK